MKSVKRYQEGGRPRITQYFRPMTKEEMTGIRESLQAFMKERRKRKEDRITEEREEDKVSRIEPIGAAEIEREADRLREMGIEFDLTELLREGGKMKVSKKKKKRY